MENTQAKKNWLVATIIGLGVVIIIVVVAILFFGPLFKDQSPAKNVKNISSEKICDGVNIVFFTGGGIDDSFASVVEKGARAAQADLGANVKYVYSDWDSNKIVSQFLESINEGPDAIAVMGHPGEGALSPFIEEAVRKGIIVTAQNVDLPEIRNKYASKGFGYVGQDVYQSGLIVSSALVRKYNLQKGAEVIVFGVDKKLNPSRYERTRGSIDGLKNSEIFVYEITMPAEVEKDASSEDAQKMIEQALKDYPNVKVIITDHGQLTSSIATHLKDLGKNPGDILVAGFDLSKETVAGIRDAYVGLVLDQQPYLQGYLPILQSCLTKKYGFAGLYINTGVGLIDDYNVDLVADLAEKKIR